MCYLDRPALSIYISAIYITVISGMLIIIWYAHLHSVLCPLCLFVLCRSKSNYKRSSMGTE